MSWFPGRYKGAIRSPNSLREQSENILVTWRWFCVRVCTDSCMHGSRGVYYRRCQCGDWHPAGRTHTAATTTHTPLSIWLAARRHVFPQRKSGRQLRDANTYQKHSHLHLRGRRLATAEERVSARLSHRASCLAPLRFARTAAAGSRDQPVRESLRPGGVKEDGPTDGWTAGCVLLSPHPPVRYASLRFRYPLLPPLSSSDSARGLVGTR